MSRIDIRNVGIPTEGLGFIAQYYVLPQWVSSLDEIDFGARPNALEVVSELNTEVSYDPFWDGGVRDSFAALYYGNLNVETAGTYTLYLTSDDGSALYVDGQRVINNDGNHPSRLIQVPLELGAGAHDIEIRYFESGGAQTLKLEWAGPDTGGATELVGSNVVNYAVQPEAGSDDDTDSEQSNGDDQSDAADDSGAEAGDMMASSAGLAAKFFGIQRGVSRLDQIDFDAEPIAEDVLTEISYARSKDAWWSDGPRNRFAAEITGQLNVETTGEYTIYLTSDDGSVLYVDGERVIDNDGRHGSRLITATLDLNEGSHDIELRYFENRGAQTLILEWDGPDTNGDRLAINGDSLSHKVPGTGDNDHGGHDDTGSGDDGDNGHDDTGSDGDDHGGHDDSDSDDDSGQDDTGSGDDGDSGQDDTDSDGDDHGGHDDSDSDDDSGQDDTGSGDGGDNGQDDTGSDGDDHGGHDDSGSGDDDHGGHDDTGSGDDDDDSQDDTGSDGQAESHLGLMAQYFVLSGYPNSLNEIDFDATPDAAGIVSEFNTELSYDPFWENGETEQFAARYSGKLRVENAGIYTIFLTSDDGSALYLNGEMVIDNDGAHASTVVEATLELDAGDHDLELRYFELWGAQTLKLEWSGPDTGGAAALLNGESLVHMPSDDGDGHGGHDDSGSGDDDHAGHDDSGSGDDDDSGQDDTGSGDDDHGGHDDSGSGGNDDNGQDDTGSSDDDHGGHDDTGSGGDDHGGHDDSGSGGNDDNGQDDTGSGDDDHGGHDDSGSGGDDHGGHDDSGSGGNDDNGQDDTGSGDDDHGGHDDSGSSGDDHGGHDDSGSGGSGHGGHGDHGGVDHGGDNIPGTIPEPTSPAEIEAFVAAVMAEPNAHAHGDDASMAQEHGELLDLVPRAEATHVAVSDGDWFDASTWYQGRIPDAGANVLIPKNIAVNYNGESDTSLFSVRVDGELSFANNIDTKMVVDTMVVDMSGRLEIGTAENPIAAGVNADIVIANNGDIDVGWDSSLLSRGVISHGQVEIHGAEKAAFLKVSDAPMTGDTSLTLAEVPEGWQVGDKLVISGTHKTGWTGTAAGHVESQDEEVVITGISGNQITFDRALEHDHDTPRDDLFAYVANMSRNITFSSEDGDATEFHHRGHVMFMHNDDVDVRYAAFEDLGRTDKSIPAALSASDLGRVEPDSNVQGRYSFHFHRTGTEDQSNPAIAVGNTVDGSPGWGFVHHSSNANFTDNVAFDVFGAAFVAEAGDETGTWLRNMAISAEGVGFGEWEIKEGQRVAAQDTGHTGDGFFFAGRLVEAAENVAINTTNGFVWMHRDNKEDPLSSGLDHPEIAYFSDTIQNNLAPIQGFRDNEAFGTHTGITVIKDNAAQQQHELRSVFDGFLAWETDIGANISYTAHYTLLDFDLIATENRSGAMPSQGIVFGPNSYDMVVNGLRIEGFAVGADLTPEFHFPVNDSDVGHIIIDLETIDVGRDFVGFNSRMHQLLTSDDLSPGRLEFAHNGDLSLSPGETFSFDGIKTDSIGSRERVFDQDPLELEFYKEIIRIISEDGYYKTTDGQNVILIDDFIADRATGDVMKLTHVVAIEMTDQQLANDWMLNNFANGAKYNGIIDLSGSGPTARNDSYSTSANQGIMLNVLANDSDADDAELIVNGFTDPENGDVFVQENGQLLYQPNIDFDGTDSFTYWAADSSGQLSEATVLIEVWDDL